MGLPQVYFKVDDEWTWWEHIPPPYGVIVECRSWFDQGMSFWARYEIVICETWFNPEHTIWRFPRMP